MANSPLTFNLGGYGTANISFKFVDIQSGPYTAFLERNDMTVKVKPGESVRKFVAGFGNCTTLEQKQKWFDFLTTHSDEKNDLMYFIRTTGSGGNKRLIIFSDNGYAIYEVIFDRKNVKAPVPLSHQGGKKRNKSHRRISRRSRRSKVRRSVRTIR